MEQEATTPFLKPNYIGKKIEKDKVPDTAETSRGASDPSPIAETYIIIFFSVFQKRAAQTF